MKKSQEMNVSPDSDNILDDSLIKPTYDIFETEIKFKGRIF